MIITRKELEYIINESLSLSEAEKLRTGVGPAKADGGGGSSSSSSDDSSTSSPAAGEVGEIKGVKKVSTLSAEAQPVFNDFIKKANAAGYTIVITSARRLPSHQWNLKFKGGGITPASPCRSDHQYGYALDINATYSDSAGKKKRIGSKSSDAAWKPIVDIAKSVGLRWQGAKDRVHFYMKSVPNTTKDQCKDFYTQKLGTSKMSQWGSKSMNKLENDPEIVAILDLPASSRVG